MFEQLVYIQRQIYAAVAAGIRAFADSGEWLPLFMFLPLAIVFGAVHALTPGHSKTVLATYLAGTESSILRGLKTAMILSATHVSMSVIIALFSLPLVSIALGSVGRAPLLEDVSRALLGLIGLWMIWRSLRLNAHTVHMDHRAMGVFAGLIPCPLTLFVMTSAISREVPVAGILFAMAMMTGVATTLGGTALATVFFRRQMTYILQRHPHALAIISRLIEGLAGAILLLAAIRELAFRN